jgi:ribosomal protein L35
MAVKTNKSFSKRMRVTKNGKLIARKPGHSHYNAKTRPGKQMDQKRSQELHLKNKDQGRYLPNTA